MSADECQRCKELAWELEYLRKLYHEQCFLLEDERSRHRDELNEMERDAREEIREAQDRSHFDAMRGRDEW